MSAKKSENQPPAQSVSRVGIYLAVIGTSIGAMVMLSVLVIPHIMPAIAGTAMIGRPLPLFARILLFFHSAVRLHIVVIECVAVAFLVAGTAVLRAPQPR